MRKTFKDKTFTSGHLQQAKQRGREVVGKEGHWWQLVRRVSEAARGTKCPNAI